MLAFESGVSVTADPSAGSYYVEWLTDEIERRARALLAEIDGRGGAVRAIETGYMQDAIEESAYSDQQALQSGARILVGVNAYRQEAGTVPPIHTLDPAAWERQLATLRRTRADRQSAAVSAALAAVRACARGNENLLYPMRDALEARASIGEIWRRAARGMGRIQRQMSAARR